MKWFTSIALLVVSLTACRADDFQRIYGGADRVWLLKELNGAPFPVRATLTFPKAGEIAGEGPCNRYFGGMKAPYPTFDAGPIGSTRRGCPEIEAEIAFLAALETATNSKVDGETLVLTSSDGTKMLFKTSD
ncbi:META domain-containing protein [Sulfitobacter sp.]|uniref:META domain-containing protein n=1 Tax=Sulfitobacter sp. TaxID=1903071 RepID=UPI003001CB97